MVSNEQSWEPYLRVDAHSLKNDELLIFAIREALEGKVPTRGTDRKHLMMQTFDHAHRRTRTRTPNAFARPRLPALMGDPGKMGTEQEKEVGKAPTGMIY